LNSRRKGRIIKDEGPIRVMSDVSNWTGPSFLLATTTAYLRILGMYSNDLCMPTA